MYPGDVTDVQWAVLIEHCPFLTEPDPRQHSVRAVLDAVPYVDKMGCQWRKHPTSIHPRRPCSTLRRWRLNSKWDRVHAALREAVLRRAGKLTQPSVASVDSLS